MEDRATSGREAEHSFFVVVTSPSPLRAQKTLTIPIAPKAFGEAFNSWKSLSLESPISSRPRGVWIEQATCAMWQQTQLGSERRGIHCQARFPLTRNGHPLRPSQYRNPTHSQSPPHTLDLDRLSCRVDLPYKDACISDQHASHLFAWASWLPSWTVRSLKVGAKSHAVVVPLLHLL